MHRKALATLVTGLVALGFSAFGILAADAATSSFTAVVNTLNQLPTDVALQAVQCPSASFCVAVGNDDNNGNARPVVLSGNPSTWGAAQGKEIPLPAPLMTGNFEPSLYSVACTSPSWCVAVGIDGNGQPLVLAGNPSTWGSAQAKEITLGSGFGSGFATNALVSVSCSSATACVAAGTDRHNQPLVLAGNPLTWGAAQAKEITLGSGFGSGGRLSAITCTSSTDCTAIGKDGNQQVLQLAGDPSAWGAAQAREIDLSGSVTYSGNFTSLTCVSPTSCVAGGFDGNGPQDGRPLVLAGDPATWGDAQAREFNLGAGFGHNGGFASVACATSTSCVAVGSDGNFEPLLLVGDPSTWGVAQVQEVKLGAAFGTNGAVPPYFSSVACTASTNCVALGQDWNTEPFQLTGDPSTWSPAQATELKFGGPLYGGSAFPTTLKCFSATSCFDLGDFSSAPFGEGDYLLEGKPATWNQATTTTTDQLSTGDGGAADMACTSSTFCATIAGSGLGPDVWALSGNPSSWVTTRFLELPMAKFGGYEYLLSIDCTSSTHCIAVGEDGHDQPLIIAGNPANWTAANAKQITMTKALRSFGTLNSIACMSATHCVAVGYDGYDSRYVSGKPQEPIVLVGNPATWGTAQVREISLGTSFGSHGQLSSIACSSITYCVAVGTSGLNTKPLALVGNPSMWTAASAFNLAVPSATSSSVQGFYTGGKGTGLLGSVSCASTTLCLAVGHDNTGAAVYITGNPANWKGRLLARPAKHGASFTSAQLVSTSCIPAGCYADGLANGGVFVATLK